MGSPFDRKSSSIIQNRRPDRWSKSFWKKRKEKSIEREAISLIIRGGKIKMEKREEDLGMKDQSDINQPDMNKNTRRKEMLANLFISCYTL
ncbi:hypothetical protein [Shuttleworthella satelles]|uniref:hypothetical protein n=1 Tax=Shuttleworthella satelles TaxID=177972 RepID=UPI0028D0E3AB|nr:hypothetical protein [Shuttleworthia satelles]